MDPTTIIQAGVHLKSLASELGFIDTDRWTNLDGTYNVSEILLDTIVPASLFWITYSLLGKSK